MKQPHVYILASKKHGVLYIGVTAHLTNRIQQHRDKAVEGFTKKYHVTKLVYAERHETLYEAFRREKQLKWWKRDWKIALVESVNPTWKDLSGDL